MFRQLLNTLRSHDSLDRAISELTEMLEHGKWMFMRANEVLHSVMPAEQVRDSLYARDRAINDLERSIRRKILRHLTINRGYDAAVCLALMSVAKDAERIGDYCKNVFEVGRFYNEGFTAERYIEPLQEISEQTVEMFTTVAEACRKFDDVRAQKALQQAKSIRSRCNGIIEELFRDESEIEVHEAIAYSLLARHYKRVAGHLSNIATAVFGNLEELDFYPDKGG
jgi:phosphate transport system protein